MSLTFAIVVVWILHGDPHTEIYRVKDEETCWAQVAKLAKVPQLPENSTITCIPLRDEKSI